MNNYPAYKVWMFGNWLREGHEDIPPYAGTWVEFLKDPDFIEFRKKHEITDKQLSIIKKGFHGWPIADEKPHTEDEPLFPFGTHKGKPFSEIPDSYYVFLLGQSWITKWPTVILYAKQVKERLQENGASKEEIYNTLQKIQ